MMKKVFALLLVPLLMSACIRVNSESENAPEPDPKTDGAFIRKLERFFPTRSPFFHYGNDLWNDIAATFDQNKISYPNVFSSDFILIV